MNGSVQPRSQGPANAAQKQRNATTTSREGRVVKHRASRACQSCRTRKVRCDVLANGSRCTNCRLDRLECIVLPSRRGKGNHNRRNDSSETMRPSVPQPEDTRSSPADLGQPGDDRSIDETVSPPAASSADGQVPICVTFDQEPDDLRGDQRSSAENRNVNTIDRAGSESSNGLLTPETINQVSKQRQNSITNVPLPAFIRPLSERILDEDLAFLAQKGALTVPEPTLIVEILRGYLFSIHPFMPILEVGPFIHAILNNEANGRISLILFQAVMFAGLNSLPLHIIHSLGFESTKRAREVFFHRVRLLYEFDVESDSTAVLQSLLLMSSWYSKDDRLQTWNFVGLAYDLARSVGLHREPSAKFASKKVRHFRKRLWWSLYIRDRMIALGTRRPMRISDHDFDVSMLKIEDFDLEAVRDFRSEQEIMPSVEENGSTALMCIQLARLCVCIGHIMSSQYTTLGTQKKMDVPPKMMVVSRRDEGRVLEVENCDKELNGWFQALETNVQRTEPSNNPQSCSEVHWAILNLTYQTAVNVLHRAQALQPLSDVSDAGLTQKSSRLKVKAAARSMTRVLHSMLSQDQLRFCGLIAVTALIAACLSHMLDISSGDEDVRDASTFRLYQSLEVLQYMRGIWASADGAVSFLASVARTADIPVPAQIATSVPSSTATSSARERDNSLGDSNDLVAGRLGLLGDQGSVGAADRPVSTLEMIQHISNNNPQGQVLDKDGHLIPNNSVASLNRSMGMMSPSGIGLGNVHPSSVAASGVNDGTSIAEAQSVDPGGTVGFHPLADSALYNWNGSLEDTMGLESMAFTFDFYSDAFGFLHSLP